MLKPFLPALCLTLAAIASSASAATQYACIFQQSNKPPPGNYNLFIVVDERSGEIGTWDALSNGGENAARHKSQPPVTMKRRSDGSTLFTWESPEVRSNSYSSDIDFRAVINTAGGLDFTASVVAYPQMLHYTGKCDIGKGNYAMPKDW